MAYRLNRLDEPVFMAGPKCGLSWAFIIDWRVVPLNQSLEKLSHLQASVEFRRVEVEMHEEESYCEEAPSEL